MSTKPASLVIDSHGTSVGAGTTVTLNGVDISTCLRGVTLRINVDEPVTATLEYVGDVTFTGDAGRLECMRANGSGPLVIMLGEPALVDAP